MVCWTAGGKLGCFHHLENGQ
uniref:Uncharacterized protein n=1 Tax=Anguilla anguilla TaxID=7936 RepID=A0A0E9XWB4_ANGAN